MAIYVRDGTTNFTATKRSTFTTTTVALNATPRVTDTFTAPSLSDKAHGLVLWIAEGGNASSSSTFTATLQEDAGAGFVNTALSIAVTINENIHITPVRFYDATGYTFTTTTADKYRWSIVRTSGSGSLSVYCVSANVPGAYFYDSRTGTPGSGDDIVVAGRNWQTSTSYTLVNSLVIGSTGSNNVNPRPDQNTSPAILIGYNGVVTPDTGSVAIEVKGCIANCGGHLQLGGTSGSPRTDVFTLSFNHNSVDGAYGIINRNQNSNTANTAGVVSAYFNDGRTRYGQVVSGSGTTGSPLRVSGITGWAVDDPLVIEQTAAIAQNESRFIKTITLVSGTTYDLTLSATAGGAASGLTYTHDSTAQVHNRYRLCLINSTNSLYHWWYYLNNTAGDNQLDGVRFDNFGISAGTGKTGLALSGTSRQTLLKDLVVERFLQCTTLTSQANINIPFTGTTLFYNGEASSRAAFVSAGGSVSFIKLVTIDVGLDGLLLGGASNISCNEHRAFNCGRDNASTAALRSATAQKVRIDNIYYQGNRAGYNCSSGVGIEGTNVQMGNKIVNTVADIVCNGNYNTTIFRNCTLGTTTEISALTTMSSGSYIGVTNKDGTNYADFTYYPNGTTQRTGSGLADTTTRTVGNYATRIAPTSSTDPLIIEYYQPVEEDKAISAFGYVATNAAFNADTEASAIVELFLPGSTTADDSYTVLKTTTDYQLFALADTYEGVLTSEALIRITVYANDANAYLYFADPLNGSNDYTGQNIWRNALPSNLMPATLGDPIANAVALLQTVYAPYSDTGNVAEALGNADAPTASEVATAVWQDDSAYTGNQKGKKLVDAADDADTAANK